MIKGIIFDWIGTLYDRHMGVYPWTTNVLETLQTQGYKIGLISIASGGSQKRWGEIHESGLISYFGDYVIIDSTKNEEQFERLRNKMKISPEEIAVVDDRTVRGIQLGNSLGYNTFWIQKGEYSDAIPDEITGEPNYRIDTIEDLLIILDSNLNE